MKGMIVEKGRDKEKASLKTLESYNDSVNTSRPLSKKAQEMKIFLERNPIPKEFLKS